MREVLAACGEMARQKWRVEVSFEAEANLVPHDEEAISQFPRRETFRPPPQASGCLIEDSRFRQNGMSPLIGLT
jgi:hypothetical protein